MLPRQEGPPLDPTLGRSPSWTSGDVLLWLKRACGTNPKTRSAAEVRPINWLNDYLDIFDPDWTKKRDILLAWAQCRADRMSFQDFIRSRPRWGSPATVYRLRDEAAAQIAAGINAAIVEAQGGNNAA